MMTKAHARRGYRVFCDSSGWHVALYSPRLPKDKAAILATHLSSSEAFDDLRHRIAKWEVSLRLSQQRGKDARKD